MKRNGRVLLVGLLLAAACGALVWTLAARPAEAITVMPHMLLPGQHVLLEVHPNERARFAERLPSGVGDNDYDVATTSPAGLYPWKAYTFHGHHFARYPGDFWIQVCAQAFDTKQNSATSGGSLEDLLQMEVDGQVLRDYWNVQSGPAGGPQWKGDALRAHGEREVLEFYYHSEPLTDRPVHRIGFRAQGSPIIWWIKVFRLPMGQSSPEIPILPDLDGRPDVPTIEDR